MIRHSGFVQKLLSTNQTRLLRHVIHNCTLSNEYGTSNFEDEEEKRSEYKVKKLLDDTSPLKFQSSTDYEWATTPYPSGTVFHPCDQAKHSLRPKCDPRQTSIVQFPGQGSQFVGMGKDLLQYPVVPDMFAAASEILGYDLLKLCLNGPKEKLDRTEYCQPAVVVCSLAALERLKDERPEAVDNCIATAGFSVGEITSLIFAGALTFERGIKLVKVRAEAMQHTSDMCKSGMMTVLYGPDSQLGQACVDAKEHCRQMGIQEAECCIANYLFPHCKVVAGNEEALQFLEKHAKEYKLRKLSRLPVSGAFHSSLMKPASEPFKLALNKAIINDPIISVHSNIYGKRYKNAEDIYYNLPRQIYKPVRWEQLLHILYTRDPSENFPKTYECGPGKSLRTILTKVNNKAAEVCYNVLT